MSIYDTVMAHDYECKRVKVTCPRCGGTNLDYDGYSTLCRDCPLRWHTLTNCDGWGSQFNAGDDSRLYRNPQWLNYP